MSKIGKININIPEKTKILINGSIINVEGPLGKKTLNIDTNIFDVYSGKELENNSKSLAISLMFRSDKKTLVDQDVDDRVLNILDKLKEKFNIIQR